MQLTNETNINSLELSGEGFKFIRKMSGHSLESLGKKMNLSRSTLSTWENQQQELKPYQVILLIEAIGPDLYKYCQELWQDGKREKDYISQPQYLWRK